MCEENLCEIDWPKFREAARGLGISDLSTLPGPKMFEPPVLEPPLELGPMNPLTKAEWAVIGPVLLDRHRYQSRIAPRDYVDFVLLAARYDFAWSILPVKPWSAHAARMKFIRDCRLKTWSRVLAAAESAGLAEERLTLLAKVVAQQERTLARCEDYKIRKVSQFMQTEPSTRRRQKTAKIGR
jgi:hypothetical protein